MLPWVVSILFIASLAVAADFRVAVGQNGLTYTPNQITAANGDTVTCTRLTRAHDLPDPHSCILSEKPHGYSIIPCTKLVNATTGQTGFASGFVPVASDATNTTAWTIRITDTKPIWVYCGQTGHCQAGMVMAINAPSTGNTFDAFLANAKTGGNSASAVASPSGSSTFTPSPSSISVGSNVRAMSPVVAIAWLVTLVFVA